MKLIKQILFVFILSFFALILPFSVFAQQNFRSGDAVVLRQDQTVNRDYFATGQDVSIDGTVNGDAYVAGGNVTLNGKVSGDLLVAGGNLNINGVVSGNIRAAGGNITINGNIGKNISVVGGSITTTPNAKIAGSLTSAGGNLNLLSPIGKEASLAGGQVNIGNTIESDINAAVGQLTLSPQAKINGSVTYWSEEKAKISPQASVSGKITQNIPPKRIQKEMSKAGAGLAAGIFTAFKIMSFLMATLIGFLLLKLFPVFTTRVSQTVKTNMLSSLGIGFLALAVTPLALLLLFITILGIPIAIIWIFVIIFDLWFAKIFVSIVLGTYIANYFKKKGGVYLIFLLGLVIYYVIELIPVIGWIFALLACLTGLGAIIITKRKYYLEMRKKKLL